jgi:acetyl-CoA carboxylase biotin carboxyl carrier protein
MPIQTVKTDITGKVWKIEVEVGERLKEDQAILILESMKMEIPVTAPLDCVVIEILVTEGDSVTEGDVIAHVET